MQYVLNKNIDEKIYLRQISQDVLSHTRIVDIFKEHSVKFYKSVINHGKSVGWSRSKNIAKYTTFDDMLKVLAILDKKAKATNQMGSIDSFKRFKQLINQEAYKYGARVVSND